MSSVKTKLERFPTRSGAVVIMGVVLMGVVVMWPPESFSEGVALCAAIDKFMETVFRAASFDEDQRSRLTKYNVATDELMQVARRHFGPSWDPGLFKKHVSDYVEHQETYRAPPPGWTPKGSRENIILFSDIARTGLRIDLNLMGWCQR